MKQGKLKILKDQETFKHFALHLKQHKQRFPWSDADLCKRHNGNFPIRGSGLHEPIKKFCTSQ